MRVSLHTFDRITLAPFDVVILVVNVRVFLVRAHLPASSTALAL